MNWAIIWFILSVILFLVLILQHVDNNHIWRLLIKNNEERAKLERDLIITKAKWAIGYFALKDIHTQNDGQRTFEIWAKHRAKDALERMEKYNRK